MYSLNLFRSLFSESSLVSGSKYLDIISKAAVAVIFLFLIIFQSQAQEGRINLWLEGSAGYTTSGTVPFWLRSNAWGNVPPSGFSSGLTAIIIREYSDRGGANWGGGLEARLNAGREITGHLIQGYAKMKVVNIELKAGRFTELTGLCDSSLSSGSFSISGNAPGIPGIQLGIPEYLILPFLGELFAFKGNFSHGWLGKTATNLDGITSMQETWFHKKSLYGRIGKPDWRFKLYGGFNHQVFWGNESRIFGKDYTLSNLETYYHVITGKNYSTLTIEPSRIGNHLGSFDLGAEFEFRDFRMLLYRQNFYDFIALKYLANISDGLNGISLVSKSGKQNILHLNRLVIEFMYSKNQGVRYSRRDPAYYNENYYNNYIYSDGWSYKGYGLGSPLITPKIHVREGLSDEEYDYFHNNRVAAIHLGVEGEIGRVVFTIKSTYSRNYGTYFSAFDEETGQFSGLLRLNRMLAEKTGIGLMSAVDRGGLLNNSYGLLLSLYHSF